MLYTFTSAAAAKVIMLESPGRRLLQALGKTPGQAGIVLVADMPQALAQLRAAVAADDAARTAEVEAAKADNRVPQLEPVSLRMRAQPLMDMLERSHREDTPLTWSV
jgi:hypothetical protein